MQWPVVGALKSSGSIRSRLGARVEIVRSNGFGHTIAPHFQYPSRKTPAPGYSLLNRGERLAADPKINL